MAPYVSIQRISDQSGICPYTILIRLSAADAGGYALTDIDVEWGDGESERCQGYVTDTIYIYTSHTYNRAGTYAVTVHFSYGEDRRTTIYPNAFITTEPAMYFATDPNSIYAYEEFQFLNLDTPSGGSADHGYEWNFGDGSPVSTDTNPTHTYSLLGNHPIENEFASILDWDVTSLYSASVSENKLYTVANEGSTDPFTSGAILTEQVIITGDFEACIDLEIDNDTPWGGMLPEAHMCLILSYEPTSSHIAFGMKAGYPTRNSLRYYYNVTGSAAVGTDTSAYYEPYAIKTLYPIQLKIKRVNGIITLYEKSVVTLFEWVSRYSKAYDGPITKISLSNTAATGPSTRYRAIWSDLRVFKEPGDTVFPVTLTAISDTDVRTSYTRNITMNLRTLFPQFTVLPSPIYENNQITFTNESVLSNRFSSVEFRWDFDDGRTFNISTFSPVYILYKYFTGSKSIIVEVCSIDVDGKPYTYYVTIPITIIVPSPSDITVDFDLEHLNSNDDGYAHVYPIDYYTPDRMATKYVADDGYSNRWGSLFDGRYVNQLYLISDLYFANKLRVVRVLYDTQTDQLLIQRQFESYFQWNEMYSIAPLNIVEKNDKSGAYFTIWRTQNAAGEGLGTWKGIISFNYGDAWAIPFNSVVVDAVFTGSSMKRMGRVHPVNGHFYEISDTGWFKTGSMPELLYQPSFMVWTDDTSTSYLDCIQRKQIQYHDYNNSINAERYSSFSSDALLWMEFIDNDNMLVMLQLAGAYIPWLGSYLNYPVVLCYVDVTTLETYKTVFLETDALNASDQIIDIAHRFIIYEDTVLFVTKTGDIAYITEEVPFPPEYNCPHVYTAPIKVIRSKFSDETYKNILYNIDKVDGTDITCTIRKGDDRISQIHIFTNVIQFQSKASDLTASHHWDFGDGGMSIEVHPIHLYNAPGKYAVTLTVSTGGISSTFTGYAFVSIPHPVADINIILFDDDIIPSRVGFQAAITLNEGMNEQIVSYQWKLDETDIATTRNCDTYIAEPGTHTVFLTVVNNYGKSKTVFEKFTIGYIPEARFIPTTVKNIPDSYPVSVQFTDTSIIYPTFDTPTYLWDFGDDETSTEQNPLHNFSEEGTYTVTLTVTNEYGSSIKTGSIILLNNMNILKVRETISISDIANHTPIAVMSEIISIVEQAISISFVREVVNIIGHRIVGTQGSDEYGIGHTRSTMDEYGTRIKQRIKEFGAYITSMITYKTNTGVTTIEDVAVCSETVYINCNAEEVEPEP